MSAEFERVVSALDAFRPGQRHPDELGYEADVADHLTALGFDVVSNAAGVVANDVTVEVRAHVAKTTEVDRALRQLETLPGGVVLVVCGDCRADLLASLDEKVSSLRARGRTVAMVVGREA